MHCVYICREPDRKKYPSIDLAYAAGRAGGTMTGVMSAANEMVCIPNASDLICIKLKEIKEFYTII